MKVLFATFELAPFTKVGGLADVMGSLPKYLEADDMEMAIFTPLIGSIDQKKYDIREIPNSQLRLKFGYTSEYIFNVSKALTVSSEYDIVPIKFVTKAALDVFASSSMYTIDAPTIKELPPLI